MRTMVMAFLLCAPLALAGSPITEVVTLLQGMLDKSKADGKTDRDLFAKFKCFCDTTTDEKTTAIQDATDSVESMTAELMDLKAQNEGLSVDVAHLAVSMEENEGARASATTIREKENEDFVKTEADLTTGISQLGRAVDLLAAVGADQTESGDASSAQLMAEGATAAAKGSFMAKQKGSLSKLTADMKSALRAASVFLTGEQRKKVSSFVQAFIQAPTGNYNSQSGEIVGVLKSMMDTFKSNLDSATGAEAKAKDEYDALIVVKVEEFGTMETTHGAKKQTIGDNSETIATRSSELDTVTDQRTSDTDFLGDVTQRCSDKKHQYEHRTMLRANEEAAIAQAVAILNSDSAFSAFGKTGATGDGAPTSFVQTAMSHDDAVRGKVIRALLAQSKNSHSMRLARIAAALTATNPFSKVLEMIRKTVTVIASEGTADDTKHAWCETEQGTNGDNLEHRTTDIGTLDGNIGQLEISVRDTVENIRLATEDLASNRDTQTETTATRQGRNDLFHESLKNQQDAQRILSKAVEVLTKYYAFLHSHNAVKTYAEHKSKDSGGSNLERLAGKSQTELEEACSANPECAGFNSAGWLKSAIAPEGEWYDWDEGSLFVKELSEAFVQEPVEGEPESFGDTMDGQADSGNEAITMIEFILKESKTEMDDTINTEKKEQGDFEAQMTSLTAGEETLKESIGNYKLDKAKTSKSLEQAHTDLATTTKEKMAIEEYLASIKPGCTFIQTNLESRKQNREAETTALNGAIALLEETPAFKAAEAAAETEALGKCGEEGAACATEGRGHAKCEACLEGVTVFGYCAQNADASGCEDATATSSAGALALVHRKK